MRNPRIAFKTNASHTVLATLNQNKFACFGHGLNLKTRGVTRTISAVNKMVPTETSNCDLDKSKYHVRAMYGIIHNNVQFTGPSNVSTQATCGGVNIIPRSFFNLPWQMDSYFIYYMII